MSHARGGWAQDPAMMWCLGGLFGDFELRWWGFGVESCHTWCSLRTTWTSWHIHPEPQTCWVLRQGLTCLNREGGVIHTCAQVYNHKKKTKKPPHSCINIAESLTVTLLAVLGDYETRLAGDTCEGALCVGARSLGARSGQRTLINICRGTTQRPLDARLSSGKTEKRANFTMKGENHWPHQSLFLQAQFNIHAVLCRSPFGWAVLNKLTFTELPVIWYSVACRAVLTGVGAFRV